MRSSRRSRVGTPRGDRSAMDEGGKRLAVKNRPAVLLRDVQFDPANRTRLPRRSGAKRLWRRLDVACDHRPAMPRQMKDDVGAHESACTGDRDGSARVRQRRNAYATVSG